MIQTTLDILSKYRQIDEGEFHQLSTQYYEMLKTRSEQANIMRHFADGNIHKLSDKEDGFQLIKNIPRQSYFIIQNDEDEDVWNKYLALEDEPDFFKRRQKFHQIKKDFMERIVNQLNRNASSEIIPLYPEDNRYDPKTGLLPGNIGYEII